MADFLPSRPRSAEQRRATIAIVASSYHELLMKGLTDHARAELGVIAPAATILSFDVPGAFEIPLVVQEVAAKGGIHAIIALGVIIEGETAHARLIGESITNALQRIALQHRVPVIHEVLLVKNSEQAHKRCIDDALNRGTEAARVAVRMIQTMAQLAAR